MVFDNLSDVHLEELSDLFRVNEYKKNQTIEAAHLIPKEVHFIISGGIKRVLKKSETREQIFEISYPDGLDCFYIEWLAKAPSSADLVATCNDTLVISIALTDWERFLSKHTLLRERFMDYLFLKYQNMEIRLTTKLLFLTSKERYQSAIKGSPKLNWELTKKEMGAYIGVAPETISRLLSNLSPKII